MYIKHGLLWIRLFIIIVNIYRFIYRYVNFNYEIYLLSHIFVDWNIFKTSIYYRGVRRYHRGNERSITTGHRVSHLFGEQFLAGVVQLAGLTRHAGVLDAQAFEVTLRRLHFVVQSRTLRGVRAQLTHVRPAIGGWKMTTTLYNVVRALRKIHEYVLLILLFWN